MTEKQLQELVLECARAHGVLAYHTFDSRRSQPGFPDLVLVGSRAVLFVELKSATGKLSLMQEYWLAALEAAGQVTHLWRPADWPDGVVRQLRAIGRIAFPPPPPSPAEVRKRFRR